MGLCGGGTECHARGQYQPGGMCSAPRPIAWGWVLLVRPAYVGGGVRLPGPRSVRSAGGPASRYPLQAVTVTRLTRIYGWLRVTVKGVGQGVLGYLKIEFSLSLSLMGPFTSWRVDPSCATRSRAGEDIPSSACPRFQGRSGRLAVLFWQKPPSAVCPILGNKKAPTVKVRACVGTTITPS